MDRRFRRDLAAENRRIQGALVLHYRVSNDFLIQQCFGNSRLFFGCKKILSFKLAKTFPAISFKR
jgi:hypothetical protein